MGWRLHAWLSVPLLAALAWSGEAHASQVRLDVGFSGEIVADAWNPIRLTLRDQPDAELKIDIDQGSLRAGEQWLRYRAPVRGGSGLSVFEDDLYIPAWRTFNWSLETRDRVLASGSFDSRHVDGRGLALIVAERLGAWSELFDDDTRVVDVGPHQLPERTAAYSAVDALLIDGTTAAPTETAVLAAAVGGTVTVLIEPLPRGFEGLLELAGQPDRRYGSGWIVRSTGDDVVGIFDERSRIDARSLIEAVTTPDLTKTPRSLPTTSVALALAAYIALTLPLVRFGRAPGLVTALAVAAVSGAAALTSLRPDEATMLQSRAVYLGSGGLAAVFELRTAVHLPKGELEIPGRGYPLDVAEYTQGRHGLTIGLPRWSTAKVMMAPRASRAVLAWRQGALANRGDRSLSAVFVVGVGPQEDLPPGGTTAVGTGSTNPVATPEFYEPLARLLPAGSAVARDGTRVHVALPETAAAAWRPQ